MENTKKCKNCSENFVVSETNEAFYKKMDVPAPTLCPTCRMQRRLAYRNDRSLYHSKSAKSGKPIISMYAPEHNFVVYDEKEWWADDWDAIQFGRDYDSKKSFFDQYHELQKVVPRFNIFNRDTENCDFVNYAPHCKNCYLLFGSWFNQDCLYGQTLNECKDCIDNLFLDKSELCYENVDSNNNYSSFYCQNCSNAIDSYFCFDCKNIKNCIGCWNLRNKEYHILNKPVSKEVFEKQKELFKSRNNLNNLKKEFIEHVKKAAIHQAVVGLNNENVSGNFIFNCKNAQYCFSAYRGIDIAFSARAFDLKDSYDFDGGGKSELTYENMSNDFSYFSVGCTTCENLNYSHYCDLCFNCGNCLGCVGLRNKKFCILNKQYTEEEYNKLSKEIIDQMKKSGEWGEFMPISMSQFAYNETMAQEYFPITKEEALKKGYKWKDEDIINKYEGPKINIPDNIDEVTDEITKQILTCEKCSKNFKIIEKELNFHKKMNLPVTDICPNCRHKARMDLRNPRKLWDRNCSKCGIKIQTSYAPERSEKVYCEACYLKEVY